MLRRLAFALLVALASLAPPCSTTRAHVAAFIPSKTVARGVRNEEDPARVAWARAARLRRGVNLSHWFSQSPGRDYSETHLRTHTTARDMGLRPAFHRTGIDSNLIYPFSVEGYAFVG